MKELKCLAIGLIVVMALGGIGCGPGVVPGGTQTTVCMTGQQTGVWVSGQGEAMATPDVAILSLGIEVQKDSVAEAQAEASEAMERVMAELKDDGMGDEDIQTERFSVYPVTQWDEKRDEQRIIGYRVTNMVSVKVRDVEKTGEIIDHAVSAGGDYIRIRDIGFTVEDPKPFYEEARAEAVADARNKARQLADLADVRLGKPSYVSEGSVYVPLARDYYGEAKAGGGPAPVPAISPGELRITVTVQMVYEIG